MTPHFQYSESPDEADRFYATYADEARLGSFREAESQQRNLFDAVERQLGALGLSVVRAMPDGEGTVVVDQEGRKVAIYVGGKASGI